MNRIQIIGPSGSGKTTLAQQVSKKLHVPHYELDLLFWLPEWREKPKEQYIHDIQAVINEENWVLCGNYFTKTEGLILGRVTTVVWLNYPSRIFLTRMTRRTVRRLITREKIWGHSRESFVDFFMRPKKSLFWNTIRIHRNEGRRRYQDKLNRYGFEGQVIELTSQKETDIWLKELKTR